MQTPVPKVGRPITPSAKRLKPLSIRFDADQLTKIAAGGGAPYVRSLIAAAPWPKTAKKKPPEGGS